MGILDELQKETRNVRIELTNGEVIFGITDGITAKELNKQNNDEKKLQFYQWGICEPRYLIEKEIKKYNQCAAKIDILDKLQSETGYVKVVLKSGKIEYGRADCVFFDEDEEGDEEKQILFYPYGKKLPKALALKEVSDYECCNESDILPNE